MGPQEKCGDELPNAGLWSTRGRATRQGRPGTARRGEEGRVRPRPRGPPGYLRRRAGPASLGRAPPPPAAVGLPPHATCDIGRAFSLPQPAVLRRSVRPPVSDSPRALGDDEGRSGRQVRRCSGNFRLPGTAASNNSPSRVGHCACAARQIRDSCGWRQIIPETRSRKLRLRSYPSSPRGGTCPPPFPDQVEGEE